MVRVVVEGADTARVHGIVLVVLHRVLLKLVLLELDVQLLDLLERLFELALEVLRPRLRLIPRLLIGIDLLPHPRLVRVLVILSLSYGLQLHLKLLDLLGLPIDLLLQQVHLFGLLGQSLIECQLLQNQLILLMRLRLQLLCQGVALLCQLVDLQRAIVRVRLLISGN